MSLVILDKHVEAKVTSDQIPNGRIATLQVNPQGQGIGTCVSCGKELRFNPPPSWETLQEVACPGQCAKDAGFFPKRTFAPVATNSDDDNNNDEVIKPKKHAKHGCCEKCGGDPKGRGWDHREINGQPCPLDTQAKHQKQNKPPCKACGGKAGRGKGWEHKEVNGKPCPLSTAGKLQAEREAKIKANGGLPLKRGRKKKST